MFSCGCGATVCKKEESTHTTGQAKVLKLRQLGGTRRHRRGFDRPASSGKNNTRDPLKITPLAIQGGVELEERRGRERRKRCSQETRKAPESQQL